LVLDGNNEKLSKQTNATAIACNSPGEALEALQAAAKHLGLNELIANKTTVNKSTVDESSIQQWLETAVEYYRNTRL
jgi:glutamyl-Q tRNA(Asp) synthetase